MNQFYNEQMFTVSAKEDDPIEALVRRGAQVMLEVALEQEVQQYLARARHQRSGNEAEFRGYRNGSSTERKLTIGSGTSKSKTPRGSALPSGQEEFASQLGSPYQRRSRTLAQVFPKLFIEGLATRDFEPALDVPIKSFEALKTGTPILTQFSLVSLSVENTW